MNSSTVQSISNDPFEESTTSEGILLPDSMDFRSGQTPNDSGTMEQGDNGDLITDEFHSKEAEVIFQITESIWRYAIPVIICIGFVGNFLTLFIAGDQGKKYPMMIRLLAVVDNLNLAVMAVGWVGYFLYGSDMVYALNDWGSRLGIYAMTVFQHYETWVIVMLSFERYVSIIYPLSANNILSRSRLKILMVIILVLILVDYIPQTVSYSVITSPHDYPRQINNQFGRWWTNYYLPTTKLIFFVFGPFAILLLCNIAIIWQLISLKLKRPDTGVSTNRQENITNLKKQAPLLLSVNFVFLLTQAPFQIYLLTDRGQTAFNEDATQQAYLVLEWDLLYTSAYINYGINFFIYLLTNKAMRGRFIEQFSCKCQRSTNEPTNVGSSIKKSSSIKEKMEAPINEQDIEAVASTSQ